MSCMILKAGVGKEVFVDTRECYFSLGYLCIRIDSEV